MLPARRVTARKYMRLAERRALIEEQIGNRFRFEHPGRSTADQLEEARPPQAGRVSTEPPSPKVDPYSPEALAKLSAEERARLVANLGLTRADVPAAVQAEIAQHDADQKQRAAPSIRPMTRTAAQDKCLSTIRTTLATSAPPECKLETIETVFAVCSTHSRFEIDLRRAASYDCDDAGVAESE